MVWSRINVFDVYSKEGGFAMIFCPVSGNWCGNYAVDEDFKLACNCECINDDNVAISGDYLPGVVFEE